MRVWVLLYNPRSENEGIYAQKIGDKNVVIAFAEGD